MQLAQIWEGNVWNQLKDINHKQRITAFRTNPGQYEKCEYNGITLYVSTDENGEPYEGTGSAIVPANPALAGQPAYKFVPNKYKSGNQILPLFVAIAQNGIIQFDGEFNQPGYILIQVTIPNPGRQTRRWTTCYDYGGETLYPPGSPVVLQHTEDESQLVILEPVIIQQVWSQTDLEPYGTYAFKQPMTLSGK